MTEIEWLIIGIIIGYMLGALIHDLMYRKPIISIDKILEAWENHKKEEDE